MALNYFKIDITIEELMQKARKLNYTKNGELFDSMLPSPYKAS
jgi:hypothetical protein